MTQPITSTAVATVTYAVSVVAELVVVAIMVVDHELLGGDGYRRLRRASGHV